MTLYLIFPFLLYCISTKKNIDPAVSNWDSLSFPDAAVSPSSPVRGLLCEDLPPQVPSCLARRRKFNIITYQERTVRSGALRILAYEPLKVKP